jgi:AcrR family transcriptional regulator
MVSQAVNDERATSQAYSSEPTAEAAGSANVKEGRRERRSRELRERIYQVAQQHFLEHGFEATTVNQIAEAADIAPATFFNHFRSKAAVLQAMTEEVFVQLEVLVSEQLARPVSTPERITAFAQRVAEEILNVRGLAQEVLFELIQMGARNGDVAPHLTGIISPFASMLQDGQRVGDVRNDCDADFLAGLVVGALNSSIMIWLSDPEYPLAERLEQAATFMAGAIAPGESSEPAT